MAGNAASNPLLNPAQPLSGSSLQNAAQQLTNAQINGPLAELARQIAQNNRQSAAAAKATSGYFNQLGQYVNTGNKLEGGISDQLNSQLQGIANDTRNAVATPFIQASMQPGIQGLAKTGLDGGAMQGLSSEAARQNAIAMNNAQAYRDFGAVQGANYKGLSASNLGSYALRGQEALKSIGRAGQLANEPLNAKVADLKATRGSLLATNEGKLRQQEIQNAITAKGLGIKQQALAQQLQISNANRQAANDRAWLAHLDRVANMKLSKKEQDAALKLKALGMSFGNIANVLKTSQSASKNGGGGGINGSVQSGVDNVSRTGLPKPGWNPFYKPPKK